MFFRQALIELFDVVDLESVRHFTEAKSSISSGDGAAEDGRQLRGDHDLDPDQEKWTKGQDLLFRLSESSKIKLDQEKERIGSEPIDF